MSVQACQNCGKEFDQKHYRQRHCGPRCKQAWGRARAKERLGGRWKTVLSEQTCQQCGVRFKPKNRGGNAGKFCGRPCYFAHKTAGRIGRTQEREQHAEATAVSDGAMQWIRSWMTCPHCGDEKPRANVTSSVLPFCSDQCRRRFKGEIRDECRDCGKPLLRTKGRAGKRYCKDCGEKRHKASDRDYQRRKPRSHRKRARLYRVRYEPVDKLKVYERDNWTCYLCGIVCNRNAGPCDDDKATLDHVVPMSQGGDHLYSNVRCACFLCNTDKSDSTEDIETIKVRATAKRARLRQNGRTEVTSIVRCAN